jgi:hypothetical protein
VRLITYPNGYDMINLAKKTIVQYRLGCVEEKHGKIKVLQALPAKEVSVAPGWATGSTTIDAVQPAILECVKKRNAKIAVISVHFADGTVWRLR